MLRQVVGYRELALLFEFYEEFEIVPFDEAAARQFDDLRRRKLRIGSRDLKIAATALVNHALLLSANRADFERVPGLRVPLAADSVGMLVLFLGLRQPPFTREKAVDGQSPRAAQDQREQTCNIKEVDLIARWAELRPVLE